MSVHGQLIFAAFYVLHYKFLQKKQALSLPESLKKLSVAREGT